MTEPKKFKKRYVVIKSNRDFSFLFKKGESVVNYAFVCYMKPRRAGKNRLGIVTGKKIGNAVKRNRSRRIIREAFRLFEPMLKEKTDRLNALNIELNLDETDDLILCLSQEQRRQRLKCSKF